MSFSFERRNDFRRELDDGVKIEFSLESSDKKIFEGTILNVSASGLSVLTTEKILKIGQEIFLRNELLFPSQSAIVLWTEETPEGAYRAGLTFR